MITVVSSLNNSFALFHSSFSISDCIIFRPFCFKINRDVTRIVSEPCACGRTHRKIDRFRGRTDDMLIIRGVNVFPSQIEQVITTFPEIATQYQIILTTKGPLDHVELRVETEPDFPIDEVRRLEDLRNRLAAELKSNLQVNVDIKLVEPKTIERSEGKAKRVIDLREAKN